MFELWNEINLKLMGKIMTNYDKAGKKLEILLNENIRHLVKCYFYLFRYILYIIWCVQ